ncbi:MAG: chloride channel protein [Planctomycetaceae bacterium]
MNPWERWQNSFAWNSMGRLFLLSILVGIVAGLGGIVFQLAGQTVVAVGIAPLAGFSPPEAIGERAAITARVAPQFSSVWLLVVLGVGGLLSGWLVYTFAPEAEGHGTDSAIDAFHHKRGYIRWQTPIVKTLASAITLGTGGSGGREGPIAQIGASFGSCLASFLRLSVRDRRILLAAGMGAGVGAVFRAPLAGAIFASEILYSESDVETEAFVPAAIASIVGYSTYRLWLPRSVRFEPLFGFPEVPFSPGGPLELILYAVMGIFLAYAGAIYIKVFYGTHSLFEKIPVPKLYRPAIGAVLAGVVGLTLYHGFGEKRELLAVLSTGYGVLQQAVLHPDRIVLDASGQPLLLQSIQLLLIVATFKVLTTSLTISSGGSGGVFGPSMVIGGCLGASFGLLFHHWWPEVVPRPEAFAIVGMAGFFSGCAHAPLSTIIMVSEMTGGYGLLLPSLWVSTITFVIGQPWKLYRNQVPNRLYSPAHRGDFLVDVLEGMRVAEVYEPNGENILIPESMPLNEIVHRLTETQQHLFPVIDSAGQLVGIFSTEHVRSYLIDQTLWNLANASDVMLVKYTAVTPDDDLNVAMIAFTASETDEIPVVDTTRKQLLGTLRHKTVIAAYNRHLLELKTTAAAHN